MAKTKKFVPAGAGMTAKAIADWFNDECEMYDVETKFKASDITARIGQSFVNEEEMLRDDYIDSSEENMVDARSDLIMEHIELLKGGKEAVAAVRESRGY